MYLAVLTPETTCPVSGGGGYLVYLSNGDVPFFRVSFSPISSRTGYQKKANFLEQFFSFYFFISIH